LTFFPKADLGILSSKIKESIFQVEKKFTMILRNVEKNFLEFKKMNVIKRKKGSSHQSLKFSSIFFGQSHQNFFRENKFLTIDLLKISDNE